ncbi:MAG: DUF3798 domain-containing protein [Oscillospiraceae bacterium]|nr:DUF3798 domain-containing protein [Oscillospiraceae bacterium]
MKKMIIILNTLLIIVVIAGCEREIISNAATEVPVIGEEVPVAKEKLPEISAEAPPWKIAIITNDEESHHAAEALATRFGEHRVMHRSVPLAFGWIDWHPIIQEIVEDSDVKAIVSADALFLEATIDELMAMREDIFVVYAAPQSHPVLSDVDIVEQLNLVIQTNDQIIGELLVMQAIAMGAETIAHYSFYRHLRVPWIAERLDLMRNTTEKAGIRFVELDARDPMYKNRFDTIAHIEQDLPNQAKELGVNTAFFGTSCVMQSAIIAQVMATGAIFVQPCCLSPYHGYPVGLGLEYGTYMDNTYLSIEDNPEADLMGLGALVVSMDDAVAAGNMSGRISGWGVPANMMWTTIGFLYAVEWISGNVPQEHGVICLDTLDRLARQFAAEFGLDCGITLDTLALDGNTVSHYVLATMDYRVFGQVSMR